MANERRAATVMASVAAISADLGPQLEHYCIPLDGPAALFRWIASDTSTADNEAIISATGGTPGRWKRVRPQLLGADLADANATIYVGGKRIRMLPAATLSTNRTLTLGTTNAAAGDQLTVTRLDTTANTFAVVNGGGGGGTLLTMPASKSYFADFYFNGTNWLLIRAGQMA